MAGLPIVSPNLTILDRVGYTYFETDLNGILISVNDALCKALGYARDELIGHPFNDIATSKQTPEVFKTALGTRQSQMGIEYSLRKKDSSTLIAEGGISLKLDANSLPIGFRGVLHDITEHKHIEESLQLAKEKVERELEIGRQIQASFLPRELPEPSGWEIAIHFESARYVSGDFYDAFTIFGGKRVGVVVADVCDKGVGAALFMALVRSLIRAYADQDFALSTNTPPPKKGSPVKPGSKIQREKTVSPDSITLKKTIDLTNKYVINNHGYTSMFATLFFGIFNPATGRMYYINAGHEPPALVSAGNVKARLMPTGPAVGLIPDFEFVVGQVDLDPGETLVAYTDGVIDTLDPKGERFGESRLFSILENSDSNASTLVEKIRCDLENHMCGVDQFDDITLMVIQRK